AYAGRTRILPNRLRVDEYLRFVAGARHQPSATADIAADLVGLNRSAPIEALADEARGQLTLAAAIASGAAVLLLDRPFDFLDTVSRDRVCEWLVAARRTGPLSSSRTTRTWPGCAIEASLSATVASSNP